MDEVNDFLNAIPWCVCFLNLKVCSVISQILSKFRDELKEDGSKAAVSPDTIEFVQYLLNKSPSKQQTKESDDTSEELSPIKSARGKSSPTKVTLTYPRVSSLTSEDQSYYLAARYGHQVATQVQPLFQQLHPVVLAEQKEFVEWVSAKHQTPLTHEEFVLQGAKLLALRQENALRAVAKWPKVRHRHNSMLIILQSSAKIILKCLISNKYFFDLCPCKQNK